MSLAKCPNCTRYIAIGTRHVRLPGGWCEIIDQPKTVKSVVVNRSRRSTGSSSRREHN